MVFLGCANDESIVVESKTVIGNSLETLKLNDQFGAPQTLSAATEKVIFAFSKDMGHMSNAFFAKQDVDFLAQHNAVFVADISSAPSLIRSMFILPGLQDFKHTVLVIENENVAASYRIDAHKEALMILDINNFVIENISYAASEEELAKSL
jgi:hypothetical protein